MKKHLALLLLVTRMAHAADQNDGKFIGAISSTDEISRIHVTNLLWSQGIGSVIEGSVVHGVTVPSGKANQAAKLLREDATKAGYFVWFSTNDIIKAKEGVQVAVHQPVTTLLQQPEFDARTALGRFLRSKDIAQLFTKYPSLVSLSVHERRYLTTTKTHGTGYDVEIELQTSRSPQANGYRGSYQVFDDGNQVRFLGANEWRYGAK